MSCYPLQNFVQIIVHATHEYKNLHQLILATLVIHQSHFLFHATFALNWVTNLVMLPLLHYSIKLEVSCYPLQWLMKKAVVSASCYLSLKLIIKLDHATSTHYSIKLEVSCYPFSEIPAFLGWCYPSTKPNKTECHATLCKILWK